MSFLVFQWMNNSIKKDQTVTREQPIKIRNYDLLITILVMFNQKLKGYIQLIITIFSSLIIHFYVLIHTKEIVERRHGEPIKFLFLPKMSLLGQYWKKKWFWIMRNFWGLFFHVFMGKHLFFKFIFCIIASALKGCLK